MALLGSWHFNENDTANVRDYSTKGLDSTSVVGLTIVAADRGLAGRFIPASSTKVNFGDVGSPGTDKLTINFKIRINSTNGVRPIVDKDGEYSVELAGNQIRFNIWNSVSGKQSVTAPTALSFSTFHTIICIYDGTNAKIIINGTQDITAAVNTLDTGTNDLLLSGAASLDADLEVVEIRDADLTTDEIDTLDKNMGGIETTLLVKHSFSEGDLLEWVSDIAGLSNSRIVCTLNKDATTILIIPISGRFIPGLRYRRRGNLFDTTRQWLAEIKEVADKPYIHFTDDIAAFGSNIPDASSVMDLSGINDRGVLFPSLTTTERDAIASPATGLIVYNETTAKLEFFDAAWAGVSDPGGIDKQIQFNDGGAFGGDANFTWDKSTSIFKVTGDSLITGHMAIGPTTLSDSFGLRLNNTATSGNVLRGISCFAILTPTVNTIDVIGQIIESQMAGTVGGTNIIGATIKATTNVTAGTAPNLIGLKINLATGGGALAPTTAIGLKFDFPSFGPKPTNVDAINMVNQGASGITTSAAIRIAAQTGSTNAYAIIVAGAGNSAFGLLTPIAKVHINQSSITAAEPVLFLNQADVSEEMIQFNTTIGVGNAIEAVGAKTLTTTHFIKVTIPGGLTRYIPVGTIA